MFIPQVIAQYVLITYFFDQGKLMVELKAAIIYNHMLYTGDVGGNVTNGQYQTWNDLYKQVIHNLVME